MYQGNRRIQPRKLINKKKGYTRAAPWPLIDKVLKKEKATRKKVKHGK